MLSLSEYSGAARGAPRSRSLLGSTSDSLHRICILGHHPLVPPEPGSTFVGGTCCRRLAKVLFYSGTSHSAGSAWQ